MAPDFDNSFADGLKLPTGTWTPWAEVLCPNCVDTSNDRWVGDTGEMSMVRERDPEGYELQAWCDKCGDQIWAPADVAQMQRIAIVLRSRGIPARLEQTGGMCCAVEVWEDGVEDQYLFIVPGDESGDQDYPAKWAFGLMCTEHSDGIEDEQIHCLPDDGAMAGIESRYYYLAHLAGGSKNFEEGRVF